MEGRRLKSEQAVTLNLIELFFAAPPSFPASQLSSFPASRLPGLEAGRHGGSET
ncbi:hypothetical protein D1AOALGA4SA_2105 [Olavius algarvensis Delta 1 endosymbiont]|nr:hypothetical protein D1AOALGA4SA_2105 [Olavius algarvensis Delta 1 endosymbiont]